jgi:hypothetical protein
MTRLTTRDLNWAVGKFIYARGGSTLLHFMPLQTFHLDAALDLSLLMSFRAARTGESKTLVGDLNLSRWTDRLALAPLSDLILALLVQSEQRSGPITVLEQFSGAGLLFEMIKYSRALAGPETPLRYLALGPEALKQKFELLHQSDDTDCEYIVDEKAAANQNADIVVINHNLALRGAHPPVLDLALFEHHRGAKVLATRVTLGASDERHTAITGDTVVLSPLDAVLKQLTQIASGWRYRLFKGLDADFFFPHERGGDTGVLLAYYTNKPLELPRFRPG